MGINYIPAAPLNKNSFVVKFSKYNKLLFLQTRDHNWAIFVNPVGVDAAVKTQATRCVAGGYVWNPFYTQLADPLNVSNYFQNATMLT